MEIIFLVLALVNLYSAGIFGYIIYGIILSILILDVLFNVYNVCNTESVSLALLKIPNAYKLDITRWNKWTEIIKSECKSTATVFQIFICASSIALFLTTGEWSILLGILHISSTALHYIGKHKIFKFVSNKDNLAKYSSQAAIIALRSLLRKGENDKEQPK